MYLYSGFWNALTKLKLEVLGLEDTAIDIHGQYVNRDHAEQIKVITVRFYLEHFEINIQSLKLKEPKVEYHSRLIKYLVKSQSLWMGSLQVERAVRLSRINTMCF